MGTMTLKMETDSETARFLRQSSAKERGKMAVLWSILVREYRESPVTLQKLMDEVGAKAKKRGLTAEKLESIINAKQVSIRP